MAIFCGAFQSGRFSLLSLRFLFVSLLFGGSI